ncbi:MAG: MOSC domain-containing protein [Halobacteriaceae archaeon]
MSDPHVARLARFPVKSLDAEWPDRVRVTDTGVVGDREFAIVDEEGAFVNGKRTADVHRIRGGLDRGARTLSLAADGRSGRFDVDDAGRSAAAEWLSEHFGYAVRLRREASGLPDDTEAHGPTVISTATLRTVASWFPSLTVDGVRRRFRASVEVGGVPPFWEDRLYAAKGTVRFEVGEAVLDGTNPCQRCVVPTRDPDTGEATPPSFRETFLRRREETLPDWADRDCFDHYYRLMVNTRVPTSGSVAVGDPVVVRE